MMPDTTEKTDRQRFYESPPRGTEFLDSWLENRREDDFQDGLRAFMREWFREFQDEQNLPAEFWKLAETASHWFGWDLDEWLDPDADEDDGTGS